MCVFCARFDAKYLNIFLCFGMLRKDSLVFCCMGHLGMRDTINNTGMFRIVT